MSSILVSRVMSSISVSGVMSSISITFMLCPKRRNPKALGNHLPVEPWALV